MQNKLKNKIEKVPQFLFVSKSMLLFVVILFSTTISGQSVSTPQIMEVNTYISSLKTMEQNTPSNFSNAKNVYNLVNDVQPSVYYYLGVVKTFGEKPTCLFTDFNSLQSIDNPAILKNNIEIVKLKIDDSNDLNSKIDLLLFSDYKNLKYIYIVSNLAINSQTIANMISNYNEKYSIFYSIDKGE